MPKKILVFCGASYVFGKEIVTLNLIQELRSRGVYIHCIVNGWNNGDFIERLKAEKIPYDELKLGFIYLSKPLWTLDSIVNYPIAMLRLAKIIKEFKPDYFYFNSERVMLTVYPFIKNGNIILHVNEPIANSKLNNFIFKTFKGEKIKYVVCSEFIKGKILNLQDVRKEDVNVIYNAIEVRERERENLSADTINIGVVGQLRKHKGQDVLFKALAKLKANNFICSVFGAGNEDYILELKQLLTKLKLTDKVIFKGFERDIDKIYNDLDIVVVPSKFEEPFGLVAVEPAQWKIPVVVSNRGGLPEVVMHGKTGFIFESENVDDLACQLEKLIENSELRFDLGTHALERAKNFFNKEAMGNSFIDLIIKE